MKSVWEIKITYEGSDTIRVEADDEKEAEEEAYKILEDEGWPGLYTTYDEPELIEETPDEDEYRNRQEWQYSFTDYLDRTGIRKPSRIESMIQDLSRREQHEHQTVNK